MCGSLPPNRLLRQGTHTAGLEFNLAVTLQVAFWESASNSPSSVWFVLGGAMHNMREGAGLDSDWKPVVRGAWIASSGRLK